jgi:hypothetical protein
LYFKRQFFLLFDTGQAQAAFKQALSLKEALAAQLEDTELKASFLNTERP